MSLVRHGRRAASVAAVLAVAAGCAPSALGFGFGAPRVVTPAHGAADGPIAVVARNGRTVVLYDWSDTIKNPRTRERALLGPDPDHLSAPVDLPLDAAAEDQQTAAEPDGTIVVCATTNSGKTYTLVCTLAPPAGGFGRPRTVARLTNTPASRRYGQIPSFDVIALNDGRLALRSARTIDGRHWLTGLSFAPAGTLAFTPSTTIADSGHGELTPLADGSLLHTDLTRSTVRAAPIAPATLRARTPVLTGTPAGGAARRLTPGASAFSRPTAFRTSGQLDGVDAGPFGVAIRSYVYRRHATPQIRAAVHGPGGVGWTRPAPVRPLTDGFVAARVLFTRDHEPLAISSVIRESETDCGQQTLARIGAGPLGGSRPQLLSNKHQLANLADARILDDGTAVVLWTDSARDDRVEYAVRPPGAHRFAAAHALPFTGARDIAVAGNGRQLLATWSTATVPGTPSRLLIATSRAFPPYAPDAPRPTHPSAPCG